MKEIQIPLQTLRQGDAAEAEAVNLRAYGKDSVAAVGNPLPIAALPGGDRLVGYDRRQGRTYYFSERDGALILLGYAADGTFTATGETIATLGSPVTAFASTGDFVVISTTDGLSYLHYSDGTYSFLGGAPQFPVMAFGTAEKVELSAEIAGRRLSGTYSGWSGSLQSADLAAMEKQAVKAMDNLQLQARQGFMLTSPTTIRTALRLWDGTMIWSPDATVVGTVSHPETVADVTMENSGEFRVERTVMRQNAWKLSLTLLSPGIGAWRNLVKAVEIYAAVWQDDTAGQATFRCEQSQQGEPQYFLRISTTGQNQEAACRQLAETRGFRLIATISGIEELIGGTVAAQGVTPASDGSGGDMSADTYAIDFNPGKQEAAYTPTMPPFSAKVTATVADRCFAGQISVKPPEPPRYQAMLSPGSIVKSPASVTVAVKIATQSGIRTISRTTLSDVWSLRLNGLVTYPDSRAVQTSMAIVAGGKKYSVTVPMQRNAGGGMAYAVCPEGLELQPSTGESGYPGEQFEDYRPCDLLAAAPGNPLVWERCEKAGNRGIVALAPSLGLGSSWQLGRHSLCLFAAEGIYLLSFDTKGKCTGYLLRRRRLHVRIFLPLRRNLGRMRRRNHHGRKRRHLLPPQSGQRKARKAAGHRPVGRQLIPLIGKRIRRQHRRSAAHKGGRYRVRTETGRSAMERRGRQHGNQPFGIQRKRTLLLRQPHLDAQSRRHRRRAARPPRHSALFAHHKTGNQRHRQARHHIRQIRLPHPITS